MELLDQLEQRVNALLERIGVLSAENASLKRSQEETLEALARENTTLRAELEKERGRNSEALARIEALVERIKEHSK